MVATGKRRLSPELEEKLEMLTDLASTRGKGVHKGTSGPTKKRIMISYESKLMVCATVK